MSVREATSIVVDLRKTISRCGSNGGSATNTIVIDDIIKIGECGLKNPFP